MVDLELEEALLARLRRPEIDVPAAVGAALRLLDEEQPRGASAWSCSRRCALSSGVKRLAPSTSRSQSARYSSTIQLSMRLAVAARDSWLAVETAAQNARFATPGLGCTLTATNLA